MLNHYRLPAISNGGYEGLVVTTDPFLEPYTARIIVLASERRLPAIYPFSVAVEQGGLMSYSADLLSCGGVRRVMSIVHGRNLEDQSGNREGTRP